MGDVGNQFLQIALLFCDTVFIFLHDLIQSAKTEVDFIKQAFFLCGLPWLFGPGQHIVQHGAKGIGKMCQFPADQSYKADNAEQHEKTEQEYIPNSGSVPGQYIDSSRNESCCQEQKNP